MFQKTLKIILKYSIYFLLFTSFFLFSHLLYLFGIHKDISLLGIGGFEGIKSVIVIIVGILNFVFLLFYKDTNIEKNNILWLYCGIIIIFISLSSIFSLSEGGFFFGLSEKHHGGLYYISLIFIFLGLAIGYKKTDYYKILHIIFIFFGILGLYGIIQKLGLDPISNLYQTRVSLDRIFSTLGNANYLAGLSIILLPLSLLLKNKYYKYGFFVFCFIILFLTKSYFGIFLAFIYIIYKSYFLDKKLFIGLILGVCIFSLQIFHNLGIEKIGSLKARPYIWISTINATIESPKSLFIGNGADTLQEIFHNYKHEKLDIYETKNYTADRSHNIFLDFIYFFGILGGGMIIYFLFYSIKVSQNIHIKESLILFLLFFSFNIPVTIHFIIIIILLAGIYKKNG